MLTLHSVSVLKVAIKLYFELFIASLKFYDVKFSCTGSFVYRKDERVGYIQFKPAQVFYGFFFGSWVKKYQKLNFFIKNSVLRPIKPVTNLWSSSQRHCAALGQHSSFGRNVETVRAVGSTVPDFTGPRFEPQTYRSRMRYRLTNTLALPHYLLTHYRLTNRPAK